MRKLTTNHLIAARLAEQAGGLPSGVKHPNQLLAAMRRAAPYLGQTRLLPLMEALFRWTQPQDWTTGAEPIVWPSNEELAVALDCSERNVSRVIAAAIEARLIAPRDGVDRKRRGLRREGHIIWAWGLNLRPMAARYSEFLQAAAAGEQARQARRDLRRQAGLARQSLAQLLLLGRERGLCVPLLEARMTEALHLTEALRREEIPERLATLVGSLQALATEAREVLERAVESADMSGLADHHVRLKIPTIKPTEPEGPIVVAREEGAAARSPTIGLGVQAAAMEARITPAELVRLAPKLGSFITGSQPDWAKIADAAGGLAQHLGIPRPLYGEACLVLGRPGAAIAVAIVATKPAGHFHSAGPAGYLRGMLQRARRGELFLARSLHGLREASGHHRPVRQLTAVNSDFAPRLTSKSRREVRYSQANASASASASGNHG